MTISENSGGQQTLFFGASLRDGFCAERYELPPMPPEGVFDLRFANGGFAVHPAMLEHPEEQWINARALEFPLRLRWSAAVNPKIRYTIEYSSRGKTHRVQLGNDNGQVTLSTLDGNRILLRAEPKEIPVEFSLSQNFPNPFNPATTIEFRIARPGRVRLAIFDPLGREVAVLVNDRLAPGVFQQTFDGNRYANGVYYCRLTADGFTATWRMMLLK